MRPDYFALSTPVRHLIQLNHLNQLASLQTVRVESWRQTLTTKVSISWIKTDSSSAILNTAIYRIHSVYVLTPKTTFLWLSWTLAKWRKFSIICKLLTTKLRAGKLFHDCSRPRYRQVNHKCWYKKHNCKSKQQTEHCQLKSKLLLNQIFTQWGISNQTGDGGETLEKI